ncbi:MULTISPECIES: acyl-CoA dehydrogenase family protein [Mycobacterium]|uniref:Acyl-CoA dehydrogenase n=1 Tax=Mycobacterium pseudoshottsii TaxID=265949 RepID=A0A9N7LPA7_9MYCO|nr:MULTISPECIES: acyl-CoA dehydrogenase family protein [Mycobacterium]EPQ46917.1 Acyl-CoA dehydrogenase, short-chain specific [Mycobacterium sp. 012931]MBC9861101.1 Butyryl-CoA dehydrogenase [Mycobacterium pseudoshottsii]RFZ69642.1 Acryloyl-CoA reductase (NADH) [Mycobacterium marinum]BBA89000.1 acyl-CoA dehydrogenase [Mycobacterium pseudoshottsii JCM 15466]BDN83310.1 acyl-CoA dehydrogenase [Mycobacterium pseudoshottsii]
MSATVHTVDPALVNMMEAVFAQYRTSHPPTEASRRDPALWQRLEQLGLARLTGAEDSGGSGASWYEAAELLAAAVRNAVRIPLAEHDLLACWLLDAHDMGADAAVRTVCLLDADGVTTEVPWASHADRIVVIRQSAGEYRLADVDAQTLTITPGANMIGEPRNTVRADHLDLRGVPTTGAVVSTLKFKSALVRAIQVCAALDQILHLSVEHVSSRVQFGRPLAKFQAVQNLIADIAAETALARAATEAALTKAVTSQWSAQNLDFLVAVARSCVGHAVSVVVRNAHQVHGAIGTTEEHRLHEFTRAALAWRSEFGSVHYWDEQVTKAALHAGGSGLWGLITG